MLRLTFDPELTLTGFRTTRPCSLNLLFSDVAVAVVVVVLNSLIFRPVRPSRSVSKRLILDEVGTNILICQWQAMKYSPMLKAEINVRPSDINQAVNTEQLEECLV